MGGIVATTTEPVIGLMRLAWWREALERLETAAPPAEPLLQAVARTLLPGGVTGAALAAIEDGWAALLDGEPESAAIARHGRERGGHLFGCAARLLAPGTEHGFGITAAGAGWALADLAHRHSSARVQAEARHQARAMLAEAPRRWRQHLRLLGALTALARQDAAASSRHQGTPGRALRMLAARVTGR